jgi:hypothetical protein
MPKHKRKRQPKKPDQTTTTINEEKKEPVSHPLKDMIPYVVADELIRFFLERITGWKNKSMFDPTEEPPRLESVPVEKAYETQAKIIHFYHLVHSLLSNSISVIDPVTSEISFKPGTRMDPYLMAINYISDMCSISIYQGESLLDKESVRSDEFKQVYNTIKLDITKEDVLKKLTEIKKEHNIND